MPTLWEILGYDNVAHSVAEKLQLGSGICVLEGPPGVGKSWLAKDIGALWEAGGGSAVLVEGDALRADASFYPFAFAMGGLPSRWTTIGPAIAGIARAGEALVGTAGLITATVEALVVARKARHVDRTMFLGDTEQIVVHELERLAKKRPMLLIADNLHWWDAMSLGLLGRLFDSRMWDAFPFLSQLRILAVQTPEPYQVVANPVARDALLEPKRTFHFPLSRAPRGEFEQVLVALGASPAPTSETSDIIYSLSGGHLALAARCAKRITDGEASVFLAASDTETFLHALLTERIHSLGEQGKQAMAILQVAALLGSTFRRNEVCCAVGAAEAETLRLMRYCRGEGVLEVADGLDRFVHDLYRQYFLHAGEADKAATYEKLSDCLRRSRPAEYGLRCLLAVNAERVPEAGALAVHAALQNQREGRTWNDLPPGLLTAMSDGGTLNVAERLTAAFADISSCRFADCIVTLDQLPRRLAKSLAAEADYLRAMCLMSTRSEQDRAKGRFILESWDGLADEEPELGTRLMLLLLYGLFHVSDKKPGWELEANIQHVLTSRVNFDPAAEDGLYTLDRCAGGLHPPDAALVRVRGAAAHYEPKNGESVLRRPVEYYRCIVNLEAKLIENALFAEALEVGAKVTALIGEYDTGIFPRIDYPYTNQLQAEYRLGVVDAETAARRQREIASQYEREEDPYYVENALAVYLALADRHAEAFEILDRLDTALVATRSQPEPSMSYLIRANRCAVWFVAGEREHARTEWEILTGIAEESNYTDRDILLLRHQLLMQVIDQAGAMSASDWDECLLRDQSPDRIGPLWKNFGHGFVMPAIELWREN